MERPSARLAGASTWLSDRSMPGVVGSSLLACLTLVAGPVLLGPTWVPGFLVWNLLLAWVPYLSALALVRLPATLSDRNRRTAQGALLCAWLLFLPNAPYLVSDIAHYDQRSPTPWLDLTVYVAFAWAGCALGVASLRIVHEATAARWGRVKGWAAVVVATALTGPGVAMGRFARLNSWEVASNPLAVVGRTARLGTDARAISFSVFFALLLLVMYVGSHARTSDRRP